MKTLIDDQPWLKNRGYLHITPHLNLTVDRKKIVLMLKSQEYIARYAFYPLVHSVIIERRYKRINNHNNKRAHSFIDEKGDNKKNLKSRPLHYASHLDAIIFGYYAHLLIEKYEALLSRNPGLSQCITAYRKVPITVDNTQNKSTIHFASEAFSEIKLRSFASCEVLKFDIKSFFSRIDHNVLKIAWANLLGVQYLPNDHYNVFKASTRFSYILKDDLRVKKSIKGRRAGFDEKMLSNNRKQGKVAFLCIRCRI